MIRANNVADIKECFVQMLDALSSPWSDWEIVSGWPDRTILQAAQKDVVYVLSPIKSGEMQNQGGLTRNYWDMVIGFWVTRDEGGPSEVDVFQSNVLNLFQNPQTVQGSQFTVEIASTTYTDTTLKEQGIYVTGISGPIEIPTEELNDFRIEFTVNLTA